MSTNVATLVAELTADTSKFQAGMASAQSGVGKLGKAGGKAFGAMGMAAKAGGLAVAAGVAVGVTKGLQSFASFDKGMNEVFTLMPGISADAMGAMEDDVLSLSKKMGILPEDIIPSLYDSISAGVPRENVFDFLEVAGKASIGGVTDLGTAVDGLTSVMNAFGSDAYDAAAASDIMFTAVRLGKTTMDELSKSLFQVNPIAAGLGVKFEDVAGSLAVLTSQGVPTRVAATQVRSALAELGKSGTKAFKEFSKASGKSFKQFIADGGDMREALNLLAEHATENGLDVTDMFGSIEAGMAAMALTSETGAEAFADAMDEMNSSAGATEAAFGQMDQGMSRAWDKIKSNFSAALVEIGKTLAPFVEQFMDWFVEVLPGALEWFKGAMATVGPIIAQVGAWLGENLPVAIGYAKAAFEAIWPIIQNVAAWLMENIPKAVAFLQGVFEAAWPIIKGVWDKISSVISTFVGWFQGDGAKGVGSGASKITDFFKGLWEDIKPIWEKISELVSVAMETIGIVIGLALDGIQAFWENHGEAVMSFLSQMWESIRGVVEGTLDIIIGIFNIFKGIFTGDWETFWEGIKGVFEGVWKAIVSVLEYAWEGIKLAVRVGLDAVQNLISTVWNAIKTATSSAWNGIKDAIVGVASGLWNAIVGFIRGIKNNMGIWWDKIRKAAMDAIKKLPGELGNLLIETGNKIAGMINFLATKAWDLGKAVLKGILNGLAGLASGLYNKLKGAFNWAFGKVKRLLGIGSPSREAAKVIGEPIAEGVLAGVAAVRLDRGLSDSLVGSVRKAMENTRRVADKADEEVGKPLGEGIIAGVAKVAVDRGLTKELVNPIDDVFGELLLGIEDMIGKMIGALRDFLAEVASVARKTEDQAGDIMGSVRRAISEIGKMPSGPTIPEFRNPSFDPDWQPTPFPKITIENPNPAPPPPPEPDPGFVWPEDSWREDRTSDDLFASHGVTVNVGTLVGSDGMEELVQIINNEQRQYDLRG